MWCCRGLRFQRHQRTATLDMHRPIQANQRRRFSRVKKRKKERERENEREREGEIEGENERRERGRE